MASILPYRLLILGFVLLFKGMSSIARRFKVSDLFIGLTVVAFGTSTPKFFVNIVASMKGNGGNPMASGHKPLLSLEPFALPSHRCLFWGFIR